MSHLHNLLRDLIMLQNGGVDPTPLISMQAFSSNDISMMHMPAQKTLNLRDELPSLFAASIQALEETNLLGRVDRIVLTIQLPGAPPIDLSDPNVQQFKEPVKMTDLPLVQAEIERQQQEGKEP